MKITKIISLKTALIFGLPTILGLLAGLYLPEVMIRLFETFNIIFKNTFNILSP